MESRLYVSPGAWHVRSVPNVPNLQKSDQCSLLQGHHGTHERWTLPFEEERLKQRWNLTPAEPCCFLNTERVQEAHGMGRACAGSFRRPKQWTLPTILAPCRRLDAAMGDGQTSTCTLIMLIARRGRRVMPICAARDALHIITNWTPLHVLCMAAAET